MKNLKVELKDIKKFYGHFLALDDLSIEVEEGALFGLIGPNGAGKTTALKVMSGIIYPDQGTVSIDDLSPQMDGPAFKSVIGYVPESFGAYNGMKVSEYMEFFASCYGMDGFEGRKRKDELLSYVELSDREDFYVEALSTGLKQRLSLARALIHDPEVLIMDEPTSGLDPRTRYEFKEILGELSDKGKTIIISSHILSDISELCTDIGIIDHGSLVISGKLMDVMKEVTSQNSLMISMYKKTPQAIKFLRSRDKVNSLSIKGNELMVGFTGSGEDEAKLLKEMVSEGLPVRSFSREKSSLESLFMELTGHNGEETVLSYDTGGSDE